MLNLTVGVFGDQELAKRLGKKGTTNDIAIYNHASSEGVFTFVCPNSDKIQPLMQALNMIDVPILVANSLTKEIGEMIVGISEMGFEKGFIISTIAESIQPMIKGTPLEKFEMSNETSIRQKLLDLKIERPTSPLLIPVDNYFNVKGIGTVVLGLVKSGTVRLHDKLMIEPLGREVLIKGIQANDQDIDEAGPGKRVGLNLKGVEADEIKRGNVVCESMEKSSDLKLKFAKSRYSKEEIKEGINVLLSVGLQVVTCRVEKAGEEIVLKANSQVAYQKGQRCLVASMAESFPRILGSGIII
jgi:selenocysteine-specific translation elongation factor